MFSSVAAGVNTSRTKQRAETRVVAAAIIAILQCALQSYMMKASLSRENGLPRIVPEYVLPSHTAAFQNKSVMMLLLLLLGNIRTIRDER